MTRCSGVPRRRLAALVASFALAGTSCAEQLGEGTLGSARALGYVLGLPPNMPVLPPISDRDGNIYVLAGSRKAPETFSFVMNAGGGVSGGCNVGKGDRVGPVGWVGFAQSRAYYWSGAALVQLRSSGDCRQILDRDPGTGTALFFRAVFPWVADRPSRNTAVALLQGSNDPTPLTVLLDLNPDRTVATTPRPFEPSGARNVVVLGVGASAALRRNFLVVSYQEGEATRVEARFYDEEGAVISRVSVPDPGQIGPLGFVGFLQANDAGLVAGLTEDKRLLLFDTSGARWVAPRGLDPVGVHRWKGSLWLVGTAQDQPAVGAIADNGALGGPIAWDSSNRILGTLSRPLEVTDDRVPPRRATRFDAPRNPTAPFPLVTQHSSHPYGTDTTLTLVAGPSTGEGVSAFTLLAVAPVGVAYP